MRSHANSRLQCARRRGLRKLQSISKGLRSRRRSEGGVYRRGTARGVAWKAVAKKALSDRGRGMSKGKDSRGTEARLMGMAKAANTIQQDHHNRLVRIRTRQVLIDFSLI